MDATFETAGSSATLDLDSLLQAIRSMAEGEGVTLTPLPKVWVMKISQPAPYHRGRNTGMSLAVAASGRKLVSIESSRLVNDASRYLVLHGERPYEAVVEASTADPYIALKLHLPPDLVARTLIELAETGDVSSHVAASSQPSAFCDDLTTDLATPLLRLIRSFDDPADCRMLASSYLREICYRLLRSEAAAMLGASVTREDTKLIAAMHFIEDNAADSLTVADIASEVAMSPSHFAHRFRACFGLSPMRYRKQVRLERARLMLLNTAATVSMAADATGYASDAHFARDFKELFGLSPRAYARSMRANFIRVDKR
jgi:AraC-like DNA-binding protein